MGHKKANFPRLRGGAVSAHAPVTLRNNDGRESRAEAPTMRIRALQLQIGEARVSSYDLADMLSFAFFKIIISIYICIGILFWYG